MTTNANVRGLDALIQMLTVRRPAGSKSERKWIAKWIKPLGVEQDEFGNLIKRIGDSPVLWSSHTDTVHRMGGLQQLAMTEIGEIMLHPDERESNCLGADCTTGVWLMREMILSGKPGLYVFHRAEECGGIGSSAIAKGTPGLLDGIKYAIAFDRYGTTSVITHQGSRCCSNVFAWALATGLGGKFGLDECGVFTDTANYTDLVPECTNISVGYYDHHKSTEWQDSRFALDLLDKLLALDVDSLPVKRDPNEVDTDWSNYGGRWDSAYDVADPYHLGVSARANDGWASNDMVKLVRAYPEETADYLAQLGVDTELLRRAIDAYYLPPNKSAA